LRMVRYQVIEEVAMSYVLCAASANRGGTKDGADYAPARYRVMEIQVQNIPINEECQEAQMAY
jgi:hypothetical protein